jgi:hypothetical protein
MKIKTALLVVLYCSSYPLFAQYTADWTSNDLGQYGWGGSFGYDIDADNLVEFEVRTSGAFRFYNGDYTIAWSISFPGYDYVNITHPRDIDGNGILVPLNTDGDAAGELIVTGFYLSGTTYYGRFRIYDAASHNLEYESPLITGFYGSATQEDINGDGRDEIIIVHYGSSTTSSYVDVYTYTGSIEEHDTDHKTYTKIKSIPNPASMETALVFTVTQKESKYPIDIVIYDNTGRAVRSLWKDKKCLPGDCRALWDGMDNNKHPVPAGNYFAAVQTRDRTEKIQIQLIR